MCNNAVVGRRDRRSVRDMYADHDRRQPTAFNVVSDALLGLAWLGFGCD